MSFSPKQKLSTQDSVNDEIWKHLHSNFDALDILDKNKFSIERIRREINVGCSPCPDILTNNFGKKSSVIFISTVYGLIYDYLQVMYNRKNENWPCFIEKFYKSIIQGGIGIYPRLTNIYNLVSDRWGYNPEFCFTELVKTVLVDLEGKVSGLDTRESFVHYFMKYEEQFLINRLSQINSKCLIFTFSEVATFFTLTTVAGIKDLVGLNTLPNNIEVFYSDFDRNNLHFLSRKKRTGNIDIAIGVDGNSFSNSIAFHTIFKAQQKDIYVIPLPHPSGANNKYWSGSNVSKQLNNLIDRMI